MTTQHEATLERHAKHAAFEARAARRDAPARAVAQHNTSERIAAAADPRIGLLTRKGRTVAYAYANGEYVEGTVASVLEALSN